MENKGDAPPEYLGAAGSCELMACELGALLSPDAGGLDEVRTSIKDVNKNIILLVYISAYIQFFKFRLIYSFIHFFFSFITLS